MQQEQLVQYIESIFQLFQTYENKTDQTFSTLVQKWVEMEEDTELSDEMADFFHQLDDKFSVDDLSREEIRKLWQYILIRREQSGIEAEARLHITPDVVCMFVSYLAQRFTSGKQIRSIMDPAVGSANLLTAVLNGFEKDTALEVYGVDVSKIALQYAMMNGNLQNHPMHLILGDYLQMQVPRVDCMVCELPVGYYSNVEAGKSYQLNRTDTKAYSHELYIEKMLSHIEAGGFVFLLIPNHLFERDETKALHRLVLGNAYIQALLQLPDELFQKEIDKKSIFVLQKMGGEARAPKQVMLVQIPSFQKEEGFENILLQINQWFKEQEN